MPDSYLYQQIAESIRTEIIQGRLQPGDRLPSVRKMTKLWNCTPGTVQRAYQELAKQHLVTSRPGQGTRITDTPLKEKIMPLQQAMLIHRAEAFLLEVLTSGYTIADVEQTFRLALDRWKTVEKNTSVRPKNTLRFVGSHDLAVDWVAENFDKISPNSTLTLNFSGSLGGLIALAENRADIAGSHLWDDDNKTYNKAFIRKLLPGKHVALITLAHRRLGFITAPGNPLAINTIQDLVRPEVHFINRQTGSGTRVWLDIMLEKANIEPAQIKGYLTEKFTHSEVARAVAEKEANVGIGLEATALVFGLNFSLLTLERYDLVVPEENITIPQIQDLIHWLSLPETKLAIRDLGGYETDQTGTIQWVH